MLGSSWFTTKYGRSLTWGLLLIGVGILATGLFAGSKLPNPLNSSHATSTLSTYSTAGGIDLSNSFFQSLGTNGRSCGTCHVSSDAMSVTPADIQARFNSSSGMDPIFSPNDGANCPSADMSTLQSE